LLRQTTELRVPSTAKYGRVCSDLSGEIASPSYAFLPSSGGHGLERLASFVGGKVYAYLTAVALVVVLPRILALSVMTSDASTSAASTLDGPMHNAPRRASY
jgi:hypothetical protein